jgi:hypothetical protein
VYPSGAVSSSIHDAPSRQDRQGGDGPANWRCVVPDVASRRGIQRNTTAGFACGKGRKSPWCAVNHRVMIGHPAPLRGGFRSSNRDRSCDRRDGWVGVSLVPLTIKTSLSFAWQTSTRAKWRSARSGCSSVLEKVLTSPTLLEMAIFRHYSIGVAGPSIIGYVPNLSRFSWFWSSSLGETVEVVSIDSGFLACSNSFNLVEITKPGSS